MLVAAVVELEGIEQFVRETEPEVARALDARVLLRYLAELRTRRQPQPSCHTCAASR